jgi:hypothetical protein
MFPSGNWRGYWEQSLWGQQPMDNLVLRFSAGRVEGEGRDVIGAFTFSGEYDERGTIRLVKQYLNAHQVLYVGEYDGEGTIHGRWSIPPHWSGKFALSPIWPSLADAPIQDL